MPSNGDNGSKTLDGRRHRVGAGRVKEVNDLRIVSEGGGITTYSYDRVGRVNDVNDIESRAVGYEYDSRGLRTKLVYPDDSNVTYEYDAMSRLTKVRYEGSPITQYSYDELSRRKLVTFGNDANAVYKYDIANPLFQIIPLIQRCNVKQSKIDAQVTASFSLFRANPPAISNC